MPRARHLPAKGWPRWDAGCWGRAPSVCCPLASLSLPEAPGSIKLSPPVAMSLQIESKRDKVYRNHTSLKQAAPDASGLLGSFMPSNCLWILCPAPAQPHMEQGLCLQLPIN